MMEKWSSFGYVLTSNQIDKIFDLWKIEYPNVYFFHPTDGNAIFNQHYEIGLTVRVVEGDCVWEKEPLLVKFNREVAKDVLGIDGSLDDQYKLVSQRNILHSYVSV